MRMGIATVVGGWCLEVLHVGMQNAERVEEGATKVTSRAKRSLLGGMCSFSFVFCLARATINKVQSSFLPRWCALP
jgi:hypothetical protein